MPIDNQVTIKETCNVKVGAGSGHCLRDPGHEGVHASTIFNGKVVYHYLSENPETSIWGYCGTCHQLITDENRAAGPCSESYCREHIGPPLEDYRARNCCKACGFDGPHEVRNYSIHWHDGDIHCGECGEYVRMFDAG